MMNRGTVELRIEADAKGAIRVMQTTGQELAKMGKSGDGAATAMRGLTGQSNLAGTAIGALSGRVKAVDFRGLMMTATAAGAAVVYGLGKAVQAASDLAETVSKSDTVFKDQAGAMRQWAEDSATSLGMSRQAALDAASGIGNMFMQLGAGSTTAAQTSQSMVRLAADFASFHNVAGGAEEVLVAIQAAFRGEYDALQRYVPTINAAAVEHEALARTGKATAKELTALEKAAATQAIILRDAGDAAGDFERTSGGLANQQRILKAQLEDAGAAIGTALLPVVTTIVQDFNAWITANQTFIQQDLPEYIGRIGTALQTAAEFAGWVARGFPDMPLPRDDFAELNQLIEGTEERIAALNQTIAAQPWLKRSDLQKELDFENARLTAALAKRKGMMDQEVAAKIAAREKATAVTAQAEQTQTAAVAAGSARRVEIEKAAAKKQTELAKEVADEVAKFERAKTEQTRLELALNEGLVSASHTRMEAERRATLATEAQDYTDLWLFRDQGATEAADRAAELLDQQAQDTERYTGDMAKSFEGHLFGYMRGELTSLDDLWKATWQSMAEYLLQDVVSQMSMGAAQLLSGVTSAVGGALGGLASSVMGSVGGLISGGIKSIGGAVKSIVGGIFDTGAWSVGGDMLGILHKGEMVIPADIAAMLRGEAGGKAGWGAGYSGDFGTRDFLSGLQQANLDAISPSFAEAMRGLASFLSGPGDYMVQGARTFLAPGQFMPASALPELPGQFDFFESAARLFGAGPLSPMAGLAGLALASGGRAISAPKDLYRMMSAGNIYGGGYYSGGGMGSGSGLSAGGGGGYTGSGIGTGGGRGGEHETESGGYGGMGGVAHGGWTEGADSGHWVLHHGRELTLNQDQVRAVKELNAGAGGSRPLTVIVEIGGRQFDARITDISRKEADTVRVEAARRPRMAARKAYNHRRVD